MRSMPSIASQARSSSPNSVLMSGSRSRPHELTFWPSSVTSLTPCAASCETSATISPGRRLCSRPRTAGTMQYEQVELQPIDTCTQAWKLRSRCIGSSAAKARSSRPKRPRATPTPPAPSHSARCAIEPGPNATSTAGKQLEDPLALRLGVAAADGDHAVRILALPRRRLTEVRRRASCRASRGSCRC